MRVVDHVLQGPNVNQHDSPNRSGKIVPELVVMHYTAGVRFENAVRWLCNPRAKASAHFVIGRDGKIAQLVPCDRRAWHAGVSEFRGRKSVNRFSIGIELVNAGLLKQDDEGWYTGKGKGKTYIDDADVMIDERHQGWHKYPEAQIATLLRLLTALRETYPELREITGHEDVAPKRKIDPGPAFPWKRVLTWGRIPHEESIAIPREQMFDQIQRLLHDLIALFEGSYNR